MATKREGGQNKQGGGGEGDGGWNFKKIANIGNAWQNRHECLILMLSLKVNKQEVKLVRTR